MEQGFDDNTFELLYRTIYLQVEHKSQIMFYKAFSEDLTSEENEFKRSMISSVAKKSKIDE